MPKLDNATGIIKDVTMASCSTAGPDVEAKGTARNTGTTPADIAISVGWSKKEGNTVEARGVTTLKAVAPGESKDWSVTGHLSGSDPVECVLGAQRGTAPTP